MSRESSVDAQTLPHAVALASWEPGSRRDDLGGGGRGSRWDGYGHVQLVPSVYSRNQHNIGKLLHFTKTMNFLKV